MRTRDILKGITGITKATFGMDKAEEDTICRRLKICRRCPELRYVGLKSKSVKKCNQCGCYLELKTKLRHENCPLGKW